MKFDASSNDAEWVAQIDQLTAFRSLQDDWDGDGAVAPSGELVDGAVALARSLREQEVEPPDRIVAGVNGTIFFEWHLPDGYREIEVNSPSDAEERWVRTGSDRAEVASLREDS